MAGIAGDILVHLDPLLGAVGKFLKGEFHL